MPETTINNHARNIFSEGELDENSVVRNFRTTAADGKNYDPAFLLYSTTPRGFNIKAQGCAYPCYPGLGCKKMINPNGVAHHHDITTTP